MSTESVWAADIHQGLADRAIKCGTPQILEAHSTLGKTASARRDYLTASSLSSKRNFRVHYDLTGFHAPDPADGDGNGIPDFVDSTMIYLEYARELIVDRMGYLHPRSDNGAGGGDEIDIYIKNFENDLWKFYGLTYPDQESDGGSSGYIVIDNDYLEDEYQSHGNDALKVTTAHEFFHVVQFAYRNDYDPLLWWLEQTATWMEDQAWDDVNDYFLYLEDFFYFAKSTRISVRSDEKKGQFMYGAMLWPTYLARQHGDTVLRICWEALAASPHPSLLTLDPVIPGGLDKALNEFGVWNYFTGSRAPVEGFYPDGSRFGHMMEMDFSTAAYPAEGYLNPVFSASNYAEFIFSGDWLASDRIRALFTPENGRIHRNSIIFFNTAHDYRIESLTSQDSSIQLGKPWQRAILVTTNVDSMQTAGRYHFLVEYDKSAEVEHRPVSIFSVRGATPNPFNPVTTVRFTLPATGPVKVQAYDVLGRKVADLFDGELSAGEKHVLWKAGNLAGGVYLVRVSTPYGTQSAKVLLLK